MMFEGGKKERDRKIDSECGRERERESEEKREKKGREREKEKERLMKVIF